jgi:hypothetical protein
MFAKDVKSLREAYSKIYGANTEEVEISEDLIVEDLDDLLIEEIVEELVDEYIESGYELEEALEIVETASIEYLAELNPYAPAGSAASKAYNKSTTATKRGEARKAAVKAAVSKVKAKAAGAAVSAYAAGKAAKAGVTGAASAAKKAAGAAASSAKEKVKSGIKSAAKGGLRAFAGGAGRVAQAARKAGSAASKAADRIKEDVDAFDLVLEYLISEGYAETEEAATAIMANMSEEWREEIICEKKGERPHGLPYGPVGKGFRELTVPQRKKMLEKGKKHTRAAMGSGEEYSGSHAKSSAIDSALRSKRLGGRG